MSISYTKAVLLFLLPMTVAAQQELSADAEKVKKQYGYLRFEERAALSHVDYITAFPKDKETFLNVFYPYKLDQLYEYRHEYMKALKTIGALYPQLVLAKAIHIGKDLQGSEDIVGELQDIVIGLGISHTLEFITEAKLLKKEELLSFARFLADAEDKAGVQTLVDKLNGKKDGRKIADAITKAIADKAKQAD